MRLIVPLLMTVLASFPQSPDIHFVPTSNGVADAMLQLARVTASDVVYDLGSGDGAIVLRAAEKFGARGVGIEIDPKLVKTATDRARKRGLSDRVTFVQGDLFKADLSPATVVTLYLSGSINRRLAPKLMKELKPGARVVSHRFDMYDWTPDARLKTSGTEVYLWTIK
jgi:16S rRNA A1518/A1519 N6-dimethyltransferase RsmA/KsgA/DIM1 with predicted DNA glycosylase/AP lyase activity